MAENQTAPAQNIMPSAPAVDITIPVTQEETATRGAEGTDLINQTPGKEKFTGKPLFEDEVISDAQLRGEDTGSPDKDEPSREVKAPPSPATDAKPAGEAKPEAPKVEGKPPEGYVPYGALHSERTIRKQTQQELQLVTNQNMELNAQLQKYIATVNAMKSEGKEVPSFTGDQWAGFKVLDKAEFKQLKEEDPEAAIQYLADVQDFREYQSQKRETDSRVQAVVADGYRMVQEEAPEVLEDPTFASNIMDFAVNNGFPEAYLAALSDPNTKIILPGSDTPIPLAQGAGGFVNMLANLYKKGVISPDQLRGQIEKEMEPKIAAKIINKLKTEGGSDFRSLDLIPTTGEVERDTLTPVNEATYERMTPEQRRASLGG